jgi:hypothetical protein
MEGRDNGSPFFLEGFDISENGHDAVMDDNLISAAKMTCSR